jgi:hypothetical protein
MNYADNQDFIKLCELLRVKAEWFPEFDDYAAAPDFLLKIAKNIRSCPKEIKTVVECGSGISTLVIARCLELRGYSGEVFSLEHDPAYSTRTYSWLKDRSLENFAYVHLCPLVGDPPWYSTASIEIPEIDILIIDGPPGHIYPESRYGAINLFFLLKKDGTIFVDDAIRDKPIIARWSQEFPSLAWHLEPTERGIATSFPSPEKSPAKKRVLIAVPTSGKIHKHVSFALLKLQMDTRYDIRIIQPTHSPSDNNRHHIFNDFLAGNEDYLLMIDSDNPPINNPLDLIELNKDVMGCPTPVWHFTGQAKGERPIYENAYKYVPKEDAYTEWPDKVGLQKVDAVGTGCILIARRVLEHPGMRKGSNQRTLNSDGTVNKGGDIMFCETARQCGFEIFVHYNYRCLHFAELELHEVARAFAEMNRG